MLTRPIRPRVLLHCLAVIGACLPRALAAQSPLESPGAADSSRLLAAFYPSPGARREGWQRLVHWMARMEAAEHDGVRSAPALLALLGARDSALVEGQRQYSYFTLRRSRDIRDGDATAWLDSVTRVTGRVASASSASISALPEGTLSRWLARSPGLSRYAFALREERRMSSGLRTREEALVQAVTPLLTAWQSDLYQSLIDRTTFGVVRRGERSLDVWRQRTTIANDSDRSVRREGFERLYDGLARSRDLFALALIATVKSRNQLARLQGGRSAPAQLYRTRYLEETGVRKLLGDIRRRAGMFQRYTRDRARFTQRVEGFRDAGPWDLMAPAGMAPPRFTLEEARTLMDQALAPLGTDYAVELDSLLDTASARLDVTSGAHRAGGGTSLGFPGTPVGVFLPGFEGFYSDLSRLVHESGHAMQTRMMARGRVPPVYASGPSYLAEAVALFNELVVADYLVNRTADPRARQFYLERFLSKAFELVLGAQDADLEQTIYDSVGAGRVSTADDLDSLSTRVMGAYSIWDPSSPQRREQWIYARLLYVDPLYLVNYMYSGVIALSMLQRYRADSHGFAKRYVEFLEQGYAAPPDELLGRLGIDPADPGLLTSDFKLLSDRLDQLERLQAENAPTAVPGDGGHATR